MSDEDSETDYFERLDRSLRQLFTTAQQAHELHFAMALCPEMRGMQDGGWSTAEDAMAAFVEYNELIDTLPQDSRVRIRIALAFYNHIAESSGLYEVLKKLLLTTEGKGNSMWPFSALVREHKLTGQRIAPNANAIMQDMAGHAETLGLSELAGVIRDAFDGDVRNAVAHADYIIWTSGLRLRRRNGGPVREISWDEFNALYRRGVALYAALEDVRQEFIRGYTTPKIVHAQLHEEPPGPWTIYADPIAGRFGVTSGTESSLERDRAARKQEPN